MFDLLITYINFLILTIKYIVKVLAFRPPNPKGVRIIKNDKTDKNVINNNDNNNNNENKGIEILLPVPPKKENGNNNKNSNNNPNNANNVNNNNANSNADNKKPENNKNQNQKRKMEYAPAPNKYAKFELIYLESNEPKIKIPAFLFSPIDFHQYNCIIIYCHGNSGDIGTSFLECQILSRNLRCDVLSFEYPGYGLSNDYDNTNEKRAYIYIRQVYKYARDQLRYHPRNIIIYGFSLGTGIAFDLACDINYPNGGVILQSPFLSIIRIFYNFKRTYYFDIFNSCDKAKFCHSTIYFIHGDKDTIVPYIHGRILAKLIPKEYLYGFYTVTDANHNDLIKFAKENLYINIGNFLRDMMYKDEYLYDDFRIREKEEEKKEEEKDKDNEATELDISSMKSNDKINTIDKKGFKALNKKLDLDNVNNYNISSREKLNEKKNNIDKKNNLESKHELSNFLENADGNDTALDVDTKNEGENEITITIRKKK
jgi:pimeloyl-ACP methyl ester carboxylesterase